MFLHLIQMGIGNLFVLGLTIHLFRTLRTTSFYLDIPVFGFLWIFTTALFTFLVGVFGFLKPIPITFVSLIGLSGMAIRAYRRGAGTVATLGPTINRLKFLKFTLPGVLLTAAAILQLLRLAFHVWYVPPYVHDTLTYHLPNVAEWVQSGRIHVISTPVLRSHWPATFEVFETWFVVFLHHDLLIQLGGVCFYLLAVASVYAIGRGLGFGSHLSTGVALLYAYTPSVAIHATSCKNDIAIAGLYLFSMAILVNLLRNGVHKLFPLQRHILILTMAFGLGFGTKAYTVFIAPGLILLTLFALGKQGLFKQTGHALNPWTFSRNKGLFGYGALLLGTAILAIYWYARNYVVFENPFYPADFRFFGRLIFGTGAQPDPHTSAQPFFSLHSMWDNARNLVSLKIFDPSRIYVDLHRITGWGWFNFVCGISAVIYGVLFDGRVRLLIFCFVLSLLSLLGWVFVDEWHGRFLHFFPPVFAVAFGALLSHLQIRSVQMSLAGLAFICSLFNFFATLNVGVFSKTDLQYLMERSPLERSSTLTTLPWSHSGVYQEISKRIPKDEILGYSLRNNDVIYPLYDSDLSRRIRYVHGSSEDAISFMEESNIHYLYAPSVTAPKLVKWKSPYGGHQIGIRNGRMATWLNVKSQNREHDSATIQVDEWTHLAFTFNGKQGISYVNGERAAEIAHKGPIEFSHKPHFVIGERSTVASGEPFGGTVDEVAFFNRVLTRMEIRNLMDHGVNSITASIRDSDSAWKNAEGLVAYYRFDGDFSDCSGNGHNGEPVGDVKLLMDDGAPILGGSGCIQFAGRAGNRVDCGESDELRIASNLTLMAWVKPDSTDGTQFVVGTPHAGLAPAQMTSKNLIRRDKLIRLGEHLYALKSYEENRRPRDFDN